jgi:hypothetical protein
VKSEFERVICDSLDAYVLINPLSNECIFLVLVISVGVPGCRQKSVTPWPRLKLTYFEFFSGCFFT